MLLLMLHPFNPLSCETSVLVYHNFSLFFLFCFAGFLVAVLFVVNAHVAIMCRGNTYIGLPFCRTPSYGIKSVF